LEYVYHIKLIILLIMNNVMYEIFLYKQIYTILAHSDYLQFMFQSPMTWCKHNLHSSYFFKQILVGRFVFIINFIHY